MTAALQSYADRGVFRGFRAVAGRAGRVVYEFLWLTRKPMTAVFDPRTRTLRFPSLLPAIDRLTAADLKALVASRTDRNQPAHKRLDARRARMIASARKGDMMLAIEIRGSNHAYAVKAALNVINEMFVMLREHYPEYLAEQFGLSTE